MCIAVPGKILALENNYATVFIMGIETKVNIQLIENIKVGEYVLIHGGCAIEKIREEYFNYLSSFYKELLEKENITKG
ncbi:HypC/HybG/HupF family hydrogenase formation chaperone [Hathewaya massiliensis]|uniref:HypC/HybG/HupF family hydrogenase formation chaperone n=1 Tax=Hathewaya massiliensis TaxID=1964382 RepID=UPI00115A6E47|nr:HypC/HybG/HupF family hydrogenase formation chaperone [Hathewaya massiliensis]